MAGPVFDLPLETVFYMKLTKVYEKYRHNQLQVIELSCEINEESELFDLSYNDFEAMLIINGKKIADISYVLDAAGVFVGMVDDVNWHKEYDNKIEEGWKPAPQLSLF